MIILDYLKQNKYSGNTDFLQNKTPYCDLFIDKLKNHSIFKYILEENKQYIINEKIIEDFLYNNKEITDKTFIIETDISKNKHKKISRYLTLFKIRFMLHADKNRSIYIRKLRLGYITMNELHRSFVDYVILNDLDKIYFKKVIGIIDFINSKYQIPLVSQTQIKKFIKQTIYDADKIYDAKEIDNPQVISMADISNLICDSLSSYINIYNKDRNVLDRIPYIQYYKDCSDCGYYYPDELRAYEWDYACSDNWNLSNDYYSQIKRINKNTKINTLISIYKGLIEVNLYKPVFCDYFCCYKRNNKSINKNELLNIIKKYHKKEITEESLVLDVEILGISVSQFVNYCQIYYSQNLVFQLIKKL